MVVEIDIEDFEDFYKERLNSQFFKIKKILRKYLVEIKDILTLEIKKSMMRFEDAGKERDIDEKALRSLKLFKDRIVKQTGDIPIPDNNDINYQNLNTLLNDIKKLFNTIQEIARKALPKFQKQVQPEIKELNYITRKLQKKSGILEQFLRKKYSDVKIAEEVLNKLPKLITLRENIENSRADLDKFEEEEAQLKENLQNFNSDLLEMEKNQIFKKLEQERDKLFHLKIKINDALGFKKALKKMKFELEKETIHIPNININYIRDFLKNPVTILTNEKKDLPKFSSLLVQLRRALEENKLNLKSDTKIKTIEQINSIFDEKNIQTYIDELKKLMETIKDIEQSIREAGLAQKLDDMKTQIAINTAKLEHVENDLDRKNKDYMRYLGGLKREREEFQNTVENIINEPLKLNIKLNF